MTLVTTPTATVAENDHGDKYHGYNGDFQGSLFNAVHHLSSQSSAETVALIAQFGLLNSQVVERAFDAQVAVEKVGAANQLATEKIGAANQLAIEKIGAAAALQASTNHSEVLREMLKCCCEQKELIRAEADLTRALIRDNELARVRLELADAKLAAALAKK